MLQVLERIASQTSSYTLQSNVLNSTVASTPFAFNPFEPSLNDIRVNVLWFASLILSLITASFGILVKQWLREYMAVENPSPRARLRVRHVRYPELRRWRVFEIAAILPLLLQLALGLFFLGLCYLTASVHSSIHSVTLPLVIGWAVCFGSVTLMPIMFPRCPFKTRFLKSVLVFIRRSMLYLLVLGHFWLIRIPMCLILLPFSSRYHKWVHENINVPLDNSMEAAMESHKYETDAVSGDRADVDILVAVDSIQCNDELLATTISDALLQLGPPLEMCLRFIASFLENRLRILDIDPDTGFLRANDMVSLPNDIKVSMVNILIPSMISFVDAHPDDRCFQNTAYVSAFAILLSASATATAHASDFVRSRLLSDGQSFYSAIIDTYYTRTATVAKKLIVENTIGLFNMLTRTSISLQIPFDVALLHFETIWAAVVTQPSYAPVSPSGVGCQSLYPAFHDHSWDLYSRYHIVKNFTALIGAEVRAVRMARNSQVSSRLQEALVCYLTLLPMVLSSKNNEDTILTELFCYTDSQSGRLLVDSILALPREWPFDLKCSSMGEFVNEHAKTYSSQTEGTLAVRFWLCACLTHINWTRQNMGRLT